MVRCGRNKQYFVRGVLYMQSESPEADYDAYDEGDDFDGEDIGDGLTVKERETERQHKIFQNRCDQALSLIDECRKSAALTKKISTKTADLNNWAYLFQVLKIDKSDDSEVARVLEDASAVFLACEVAECLDRVTLTHASVRKVLTKIKAQLDKIDDAKREMRRLLGFDTGFPEEQPTTAAEKAEFEAEFEAGAYARILLEDEALKDAIHDELRKLPARHSASPFAPYRRIRVAQPDHVATYAAITYGINSRWSQILIEKYLFIRKTKDEKKGKRPERPMLNNIIKAAESRGLSDIGGTNIREIASIAESISPIFDAPGSYFGHEKELVEIVNTVMAALQSTHAGSAYVSPSSQFVRTIGALELLCAWRPNFQPTSTENGELATLAQENPIDSSGGRVVTISRDNLISIVNGWKMGRPCAFFSGRDPEFQARQKVQSKARALYLQEFYKNNPHLDPNCQIELDELDNERPAKSRSRKAFRFQKGLSELRSSECGDDEGAELVSEERQDSEH